MMRIDLASPMKPGTSLSFRGPTTSMITRKRVVSGYESFEKKDRNM
jgi:hypothetical protein